MEDGTNKASAERNPAPVETDESEYGQLSEEQWNLAVKAYWWGSVGLEEKLDLFRSKTKFRRLFIALIG